MHWAAMLQGKDIGDLHCGPAASNAHVWMASVTMPVGCLEDRVAQLVDRLLKDISVLALDQALSKLLQQHRLAQALLCVVHVCIHPLFLVGKVIPAQR